ncbi:hypothetical protein [Bosea sp. (in: a-proteobacteria)]|uniref:hypothetical protein n=1 Tax=Bosea sp. (in: a-proteobacteria) TaxID=1871050 RepID=UPI00262900CD|nr:hypothetical protein [Bosea sp. (in: a-proteobacteria)]MCO5091334.1 hypothetical protein [Bosea sp. (in: a-proteobacteria)]
MSHDALLQLGMASVVLSASQKEDTLVARTLDPRAEAIDRDSTGRHVVLGLRGQTLRRGNSAKALPLREETAAALRPVA